MDDTIVALHLIIGAKAGVRQDGDCCMNVTVFNFFWTTYYVI